MQKVKPAKNNLDMGFLDSFDKPINGTASVTKENTEVIGTEHISEDIISNALEPDFDSDEIDLSDDTPIAKNIKATQIVVRTTEKEREQLKAYFMRHGLTVSKGIKVAIKYLQQQEEKGNIHFSEIGLY